MKTEAVVLAEMLDATRRLTMFYFDKLRETDLYKQFNGEGGVRFNSVYWLMGHIAVTENFLVLHSTGGERVRLPWARQFGMGSVVVERGEGPPVEEILQALSEVHRHSLAHLATFPDTRLDEPTVNGFSFLGEDTLRSVIQHAIRHEASHAGHLGWLCKLNGIRTL